MEDTCVSCDEGEDPSRTHPFWSRVSGELPLRDGNRLLLLMAHHPILSCLSPCSKGGIDPTALNYRALDSKDNGSSAAFTKVYTLNMNTWIWEQPIPLKSTDYLTEAINIASADIIRAQRKVEDNKYVRSPLMSIYQIIN